MYARRAAEAALCSLEGLLVACGGGGGGASGGSLVRDLGLVSGTEPTLRVVSFTNPLLEAATVTRGVQARPFSIDAASVPAEPVAASASFDVRVVLNPGLPGPVTGSGRLSCQGAQEREELVLALQAAVEEVRVRAVEGVLDYGSVAFGDTVERTLELSNRSTLSVVTNTRLQTPSPDVEIVELALPFALGPSQRKTVRLRAAPFRSLDTVSRP